MCASLASYSTRSSCLITDVGKEHVEVRDPRTGYLVPGRDTPRAQPNGESSWETIVAAAVVAVTGKLRSTFGPENYIERFHCGFGLLMRDLGEWRLEVYWCSTQNFAAHLVSIVVWPGDHFFEKQLSD